MKATLELPDALLREIKLKAVHEGRKLKETVADLLRQGLDAAAAPRPPARAPEPAVLPIIQCRRAATPAREVTPERAAAILQGQEIVWHAKTRR